MARKSEKDKEPHSPATAAARRGAPAPAAARRGAPATAAARRGAPAPAGRPTARGLLGILLLAAAVAIVYIPVYNAGFIWDDDDYLTLNPLIVESGGLARIWDPGSGVNQQYYPMLYTSFLVEKAIWGIDHARGFHITNVVLHAANSILLFLLLARIGVPGAWLVAALFAVHPIHVESVAWITERKNVLSAFFYLLSALAFLRFDRTSRLLDCVSSLLLFALALFTKTITASLPIALGLILWYQRRPLTRSRLVPLGLMLVMGFVMGMVTRTHEYRHVARVGADAGGWTFPERLLVAGRAFWFYPAKILWPADLSFTYEPWRISAAAVWPWLFPLSVAALAIVLAVRYRRGRIGRGTLAAALFYAATIFPALGFVRVAYMRYTPVSDHFTYLATIGILILAVGGGARLLGAVGAERGRARTRAAAAAAALVLAVLAVLSSRHARIFHDVEILWADACTKSPGNWLAQLNHGVELNKRGEHADAAAHFERVIQLVPPPSEGSLLASNNLAALDLRAGRHAEALRRAEECLRAKPDYAPALLNKGKALWRLGRPGEAEAVLGALVELDFDPDQGRVDWDVRRRIDDASVLAMLGDVQAAQGKYDAARASYARAVAVNPADPAVHAARVQALSTWGTTAELIAALRTAARDAAEKAPFRLQLVWILATAAEARDRNGEEALALGSALARELGPRNAMALSVLAAAQAEVGSFAEATATAQRARDAARAAGDRTVLERNEMQIAAYARGEPIYSSPRRAPP